VTTGNWGKTPGKIVPSMDRSAPAQQGLAQFCGQRFVSGRMLHLRARGFAPITLQRGKSLSHKHFRRVRALMHLYCVRYAG
jgi:hypothetical protein